MPLICKILQRRKRLSDSGGFFRNKTWSRLCFCSLPLICEKNRKLHRSTSFWLHFWLFTVYHSSIPWLLIARLSLERKNLRKSAWYFKFVNDLLSNRNKKRRRYESTTKKERDSHRSRNKSGDPNKFIAEAKMNLVYIANRITHMPTLYVIL